VVPGFDDVPHIQFRIIAGLRVRHKTRQ